MNEVWKSIYGYNGLYEVSNLGRIKSIRTKKSKILKPYKGSSGYKHIVLYKNKKAKTYDIHRIVAVSFLENKYNKKEVNHKNGNKEDNMVDNLEWVSRSENLLHRHKTLHIKGYWYKRKVPKSIIKKRIDKILKNGVWNRKKVLCIETGEVFDSISAADKSNNSLSHNVSACCRGKQKTAYGFHWKLLTLCLFVLLLGCKSNPTSVILTENVVSELGSITQQLQGLENGLTTACKQEVKDC